MGYWTSANGDLFELFLKDSHSNDAVVATASKLMGADSTKAYPLEMVGCRGITITFPQGTLKGRVGLDRRQIIWNQAPTWYRQGI